MKKLLFTLLMMTSGLLHTHHSLAEIRTIDDEGNEVVLSQSAKRIVSLAPHITEMIYAAGAGEQLVGVVSYSDYPEAAKSIPLIGSYNKVSYESIVAIRPDLILAWDENGEETINRLKSLGFTVHVNDPRQLEDVAHTIRAIGLLTGHELTANRSADDFMTRYEDIRNNYQNKKNVSVFYQVWNEPLQTINGTSIISDVIRLCGGTNVFTDAITRAPKISIESVIRSNPEVIIASGMDAARPEWLDDWRKWPSINAVEKKHLYFVPPDLLQRHTPRLLDGAQMMCEHFDKVRTE